MKNEYPLILQHLLRDEGGFTNDANDAGGPTNKGIIQEEYDRYRQSKGEPSRSVRFIESFEMEDIYKNKYWDKIHGDDLPAGLDYCVFDAAVNSGPSRATKWLQEILGGLAVDGAFGPKTLKAAQDVVLGGPSHVYAICNAYMDRRLAFMKVAKNSKTGKALWPSFGRGWARRIKEGRQFVAAELRTQEDPTLRGVNV